VSLQATMPKAAPNALILLLPRSLLQGDPVSILLTDFTATAHSRFWREAHDVRTHVLVQKCRVAAPLMSPN